MRRDPLLALLLTSTTLLAQPPDSGQPLFDGQDLLELCRQGDPTAITGRWASFSAGQCQGYISGVLDAARRFADTRPCLPDWLGPSQLSEIVTRYLAGHPERRHRPAVDLVLEAVGESYGTLRCP
jgi:hypothetical protein